MQGAAGFLAHGEHTVGRFLRENIGAVFGGSNNARPPRVYSHGAKWLQFQMAADSIPECASHPTGSD